MHENFYHYIFNQRVIWIKVWNNNFSFLSYNAKPIQEGDEVNVLLALHKHIVGVGVGACVRASICAYVCVWVWV